jgi:hypothetical protein
MESGWGVKTVFVGNLSSFPGEESGLPNRRKRAHLALGGTRGSLHFGRPGTPLSRRAHQIKLFITSNTGHSPRPRTSQKLQERFNSFRT